MKIRIDEPSNPHDRRQSVTISGACGVYRICGYDMLPHRMDDDGPTARYTRITWEEFRDAIVATTAQDWRDEDEDDDTRPY